jgi:hypothetical protein
VAPPARGGPGRGRHVPLPRRPLPRRRDVRPRPAAPGPRPYGRGGRGPAGGLHPARQGDAPPRRAPRASGRVEGGAP